MTKSKRDGQQAQVVNGRHLYPASPCISICTLDDDSRCVGCGRTLQQITRWTMMSKGEQWAVIDELAHRDVPE